MDETVGQKAMRTKELVGSYSRWMGEAIEGTAVTNDRRPLKGTGAAVVNPCLVLHNLTSGRTKRSSAAD